MGTDGAGLDFFLSLLALSVLVVPKFRNGLKENKTKDANRPETAENVQIFSSGCFVLAFLSILLLPFSFKVCSHK